MLNRRGMVMMPALTLLLVACTGSSGDVKPAGALTAFGLAFGGGKSLAQLPRAGIDLSLGDGGFRNTSDEDLQFVSLEPIAIDDGLALLGSRLAYVVDADGGIGNRCGPFPPKRWPGRTPSA